MTIDTGSDQPPGALEVVAFLCELGMFVLLGLAGWRLLDSTPTRVAALIALPVTVAIAWSIWFAPRARRRLSNPARLIVQITLFASTAALAASTGLPWWGVGWGVGWATLTIAVFSALMIRDHRVSR